jgi:hypothetical protein
MLDYWMDERDEWKVPHPNYGWKIDPHWWKFEKMKDK